MKEAVSGTEAAAAKSERPAVPLNRRRAVTLVPNAEVHEIEREAAVAVRSMSQTRSARIPTGGEVRVKGMTGKDKGKGESKGTCL